MVLQLLPLTILLLLSFGCYLWLKARKYRHFPGNLGLPVIGNLYQCLTNFWHNDHSSYVEYMDRNIDRYGNVCCFWLCHRVNLAVSDPYLIEKLAFHPSMIDKPSFVYNYFRWFMRNTFAYLENDKEWKLRRKELNNTVKKSNLVSYQSSFLKASNRAVEILSQETKEFDCFPDMSLLAIEVVANTHFGMEIRLTGDHPLFHDIHFSSEVMAATLTNPLLGLCVIAVAESGFAPKLERKFIHMLRECTLSRAMKLKSDEDTTGIPLALSIALRNVNRKTTNLDLLRELAEVINVASHTVGTTLASALVFLATNPHVQQKVWEEQEEIFGGSEREPTIEDIGRMEYLERFFKELLRVVAPPLSIKESVADIEIDGKVIPKGTLVTFYSYRMRYDTRYWKNPEVFDPDRFLPESFATVPKHAAAFFGYGLRACPGSNYAVCVFKTIISALVRNFEVHSTTTFDEIKYKSTLMREITGGYNISVKKRKI